MMTEKICMFQSLTEDKINFHQYSKKVYANAKKVQTPIDVINYHFAVDDKVLLHLTLDSQVIKREVLFESFVDTKNYDFLKKGCWLKFSNGGFILKQMKNISGFLDYTEIQDIKQIGSLLAPNSNLTNNASLLSLCPIQYAAFQTWRYTWEVDSSLGIKIYIDVCEFKDKQYFTTGTIQVIPQSLTDNSLKMLRSIKVSWNVLSGPCKVISYLFKNNLTVLDNVKPYPLLKPSEWSFTESHPFEKVEPISFEQNLGMIEDQIEEMMEKEENKN